MSENEKKKAYLRKYLESKRAALRLEERAQALRFDKMYPSLVITNMPAAHSQKDLSDYIAAYDNLISLIARARYKRITYYTEIFKCIEEMENENERAVLTYRYLSGMEWEQIAVKMNYSYRQTLKIHGKALSNFKIREADHGKNRDE